MSVNDAKVDVAELRHELVPTLRPVALPRHGAERRPIGSFSECRDLLSVVLPQRTVSANSSSD